MSLFSLFHRKPSPSKIAEDLGPLFVQVAVHECGSFQQIWKRQLDDETQVMLFAEFAIILVAVADRLVFDKFGDPTRSKVINRVVETVRDCFVNQSHFGDTRQERIVYFERFFADRFQSFATCSSIMGEGQDSLISTGTRYLAETFLEDIPESQLPEAVLETDKTLSKSVVALLATPIFKALCENNRDSDYLK
ncbi:MAG: hypothetical protein F9K13_05310 [Candidatus Methylomirabilis oxygeniifera]|nr:MAG: hypothetical protein F9K13_05310 [Candidatus Methylomirabilis oxyfera]